METCRRKQTITRYRPPGVSPLELWDLWVDERILWECMPTPQFPEILLQCLKQLRRGEGATRSEGPVPAEIAGFDAIFASGGRSREPALRAALQELGLPIAFSATPEFPAEAEARKLLTSRGSTHPWICDLGQTSFKVCTGGASQVYPRDERVLPVRTENSEEQIREQRSELRAWLHAALSHFRRVAARPPDALFFALPSRLDDAGVPEGSSYVGMAGDAALVADVLELAQLCPDFVLTANDAELAALEVASHRELDRAKKVLVLTIGFGVGAALVCR
jgi:hypothetical protein